MRDVLGTIQADQDAIIRAGSRGALVVDGGPGTGKTVVALHRTAYLLYSDPRLGHRRGGVLFVGPHQPYLAYVADVLPSLGEEGVQTCTLRDLVPEGAAAAVETDPEVARLKSSADLVKAIETAVRFYEEPPTEGMTVETPWADVWLSADDWAEAFEAAGTRHAAQRGARPGLGGAARRSWSDKHDGDDAADDLLRRSLLQNGELLDDLQPGVAAARPGRPRRRPVVGARLPAHVRALARPRRGAAAAARGRPGLDGVRPAAAGRGAAAARRPGGVPAPARQRGRRSPPNASRWTRVVDDLIAADDSEMLVMSMLRGQDLQNALVDEAALPSADPDLLAGPFAHIVVDEAQELTDAEWQMLLLRCPSRSFTIVGDRAQARHGFTESWQERLERIGLDRIDLASLTINYRTPEEVMAEAEPVIRAVLPDANVPTSVRSSGIPVVHGSVSDLDSILDTWLAAHADGIACVIGDPAVPRRRPASGR